MSASSRDICAVDADTDELHFYVGDQVAGVTRKNGRWAVVFVTGDKLEVPPAVGAAVLESLQERHP